MDLLEHIQRRATEMIQGMEHLCYKEAERAGAAQPGEVKAPGRPESGLLSKGSYKEEGDRLLSMVCGERTRGTGFKLNERRHRLDSFCCCCCCFYSKGDEALEQVAQRGVRSPIPRDIRGQAGLDSQHLHLAVDIPIHCWGYGLNSL